METPHGQWRRGPKPSGSGMPHSGSCRAALHGAYRRCAWPCRLHPRQPAACSVAVSVRHLAAWTADRRSVCAYWQGYPVIASTTSTALPRWHPELASVRHRAAGEPSGGWRAAQGGRHPGVLRGHEWSVHGVAWHPDGGCAGKLPGWIMPSGYGTPASGSSLQVIRDCDHLDTWFWGVAWSPMESG